MKMVTYKRHIYFIIIIMVLFSEIGFVNIRTESFLSASANEKRVTVLHAHINTFLDQKACTGDELGILNPDELVSQGTAFTGSRNGTEVSLLSELLFKIPTTELKNRISEWKQDRFSDRVIIRYIHHQDGSKE